MILIKSEYRRVYKSKKNDRVGCVFEWMKNLKTRMCTSIVFD